MKSLAICIVRNAGDFIGFAVLHHLLAGVDRCIVIDNGSSDATPDILKSIAKKSPRLTIINDPSPFDQERLRNGAMRDLLTREKTVVVPFDCDELWALSLPALIREFAELDANVLRCEVHNFIQSRSVDGPSRWSWLRACRRAPVVTGNPLMLVTEHRCSFVEARFPPKVVFIAEGAVKAGIGGHIARFKGAKERPGPFACLHLPLRSRAELTLRALDHEPRRQPFRTKVSMNWQSRYWHGTFSRGEEELEWRANSYDRRGRLDVYGRKVKTFLDFRMVRLLGKAYAYGRYLGVPASTSAIP